MIRNHFEKRNQSFVDKIFALDFFLIFLILILGIISIFAMYASERGNFSYHTQNHLYRFTAFFFLFILISFVNDLEFYMNKKHLIFLILKTFYFNLIC